MCCSVLRVNSGGIRIPWDPRTQEILLSLKTLTYEAEPTLDLPSHRAARSMPFLSTALVVARLGPFQEEEKWIGEGLEAKEFLEFWLNDRVQVWAAN